MAYAAPTHNFYSDWKGNLYAEKEGYFYNFYDKFEESTGRKREEFYYFFAFFSTLYLAFGYYAYFYCNFFIGFLFPAYYTFYYLDSNKYEYYRQYTFYWFLYGLFFFFDYNFYSTPFYYVFKAYFLAYFQYEQNAAYFYYYFFRPIFAEPSPDATPTEKAISKVASNVFEGVKKVASVAGIEAAPTQFSGQSTTSRTGSQAAPSRSQAAPSKSQANPSRSRVASKVPSLAPSQVLKKSEDRF